jgi:hypothetical protein
MRLAVRRALPWLALLCGTAVTANGAQGPAAPTRPLVLYSLFHIGRDGKELLRVPLPDPPVAAGAVVASDGRVWIAGASELARYSPTGKLLWRVTVPGLARTHYEVSVTKSDGSVWRTSSDGVLNPRVQIVSGDASVWTTSNSDVVHLSARGREVWRGEGRAKGLTDLRADPRDGSCWALYQHEGTLVHLSPKGRELCRKSSLGYYDVRGVSPADGSCWLSTSDYLLHLASDGRELGRISLEGCHGPAVDTGDGSVWVATTDPAPRLVHLAANGRVLARTAPQPVGASIAAEAVNPRNGSCWARVETWPGVGPDGPHVGALVSSCVTHVARDGRALGSTEALSFGWLLRASPFDDSCWAYSDALYHIPPDCRVPAGKSARDQRPWSPELARGIRLPANMDSLAVDPSDGSCWAVGYVFEDSASAPHPPAAARPSGSRSSKGGTLPRVAAR